VKAGGFCRYGSDRCAGSAPASRFVHMLPGRHIGKLSGSASGAQMAWNWRTGLNAMAVAFLTDRDKESVEAGSRTSPYDPWRV